MSFLKLRWGFSLVGKALVLHTSVRGSIPRFSTGVFAELFQGLIPRKSAQGAVHPGASVSKTGVRKTAYRVVA